MKDRNALRVTIDAQVRPEGGIGGVISALIGLVSALGALDGPEEYVIVGPREQPDWLRPYTGGNQRIVPARAPRGDRVKRLLGPLRPAARRLRNRARGVLAGTAYHVPVPTSDGFLEALGGEVIHFPHQAYTICALPTVYNPHDLQHLHFPEFFTPEILAWRAAMYPTGCRQAHTVAVASDWVKQDVVRHFQVDPDKVQVIPLAPPTQAYPTPSSETMARVRQAYRLDGPFALYPSMTWPHKNHLRLLEALALLRDRHRMRVRLVCTGYQNDFWPQIRRRIADVRLDDQVAFLGMVPGEDLRALYRLAQFVVVPTLFEAASGPLFEAWHDEVPVACSTATSLPEQAGGAALLFDPTSVDAIADAVARMTVEPDLREALRRAGARRLQDFSWERTAKAYRAVYRRAAGRPLTNEDRWLLGWNWMRVGPPGAAMVEPRR